MGGWLRAALRLAGILAAGLAAAVVAAHLLVDWLVTPEQAERWAEAELNRPVAIQDVELRLVPGPRVHLEGVSLEPGVTSDTLELGLDEGALLERRIALESLHLKGARVALVRLEDGRVVWVGMQAAKTGTTKRPPGLPPVAHIEVRGSEILWSDRAHPDLEPLSVRVDRLDLDGLRAGEVATLSLKARVGPEAAHLSAEGHYGPIEPEHLGDAPGSLDVELGDFDIRELHARLPPAWRIDAARGSLDGKLHVEGSRGGDAEAQIELALDDAALDLARLHLAGPTQLAAQLSRKDGAFALREGRLRTPRLRVADATAGDVDLRFHWKPGRLGLDSIAFDAAKGHPLWSAGFGSPAAPLHMAVNLDPDGRVRVHDVVVFEDDAGRRDVLLPRIELRGVVVEARSSSEMAPPLRVRLHELDLEDLSVGKTARYTGRGETGMSGSVELSGELGPIVYESDFGNVPITATLRATDIDAQALAPLLPLKWGIGDAAGRAEVDLVLRRGGDGKAHVQLEGLDFSQLELFRLQASDVKGPLRFADRTLSLDGVTLDAYGGAWTAQGSVRFEGPPRFDGKVGVRNLDVVRAAGRTDAPSSDDPVLLDADGVLRGRWTGEPNWAAHLEGSQIRVDAHGGSVSHESLLRSIAPYCGGSRSAVSAGESPPLPRHPCRAPGSGTSAPHSPLGTGRSTSLTRA